MKRQKKRPANQPVASRSASSSKPGFNPRGKSQASQDKAEFVPFAGRHDWLCGVLLVVATVIAYGRAFHCGFIWDDDLYLTENPLLTASDGLRRIWFSLDSPSQYFPLTYTTFYLERALWGLNSAGYHVVNVLLHVANALLVWRVLKRLGVPGAWLAAAIFALHPVQVESVAWITERKNVLMGLFFLLTIWEWLKFIEAQTPRPWRAYTLSLVFYPLALAAKTTACTLPAALLLILWTKKMPINRRRLAQVAPFVAMGIGMGLVTVWWERHHQGTRGKLFEIGWVERGLIASRALWFYLGKLLWPVNLTFSYPRWGISASDPRAYGWVAATAALGVGIWWTTRRVGRGVAAAAIYFVATLSPLLGFIMLYTFLYSFVADHYQYLACLGPIALCAAGVAVLPGILQKGKLWLAPVLSTAVLLALGTLTWRQCGMYRDAETLWLETIRRNPESWMAHHNLSLLYYREGRTAEGIAHEEASVNLNPDRAESQNNLGFGLMRLGRLDEAIAHFQKALAIDPGDAEAQGNLGAALLQKGEVEEAAAHFTKAQEINPNNAKTHYNLGVCFFTLGRMSEAISQYQAALKINPADPAIQNNLAWILATCPQTSLRDGKRAVELAQQADQLTGDRDPMVLWTLAASYAEAGRFHEAIETIQRALQFPAVQSNPGLARQLEAQLKLYQAGLLSHGSPKTN